MQPEWLSFATGDELAATLAETIADRLRKAIAAKGGATIAVSGGTTPARLFEVLSRRELAWDKVVVTLVDERFVPPSSDRSNEYLVRSRLLQNEARLARFVALSPRDWDDPASVEDAASAAEAGIALLGARLDVVILGMGTDGHTASYFSDAPNLGQLLDPAQPRRVMPVHTVAGIEPRLTLTLPLLINARFLAILIEGDDKRRVLEQALAEGQNPLPIRSVIDAAPTPPHIFWAPQEV